MRRDWRTVIPFQESHHDLRRVRRVATESRGGCRVPVARLTI